jgi:type 1 fimbria pilin
MRTRTVLFILALGIALIMTSACYRDALKEPSPDGPSTIHLTFTLTANPNVINATTQRSISEIKVVLKDGNVPLMNAVVYFSILSGPGYFYDYSQRCVVRSNENGVASVAFLGPLQSEIATDQDVVIRAQLETNSPGHLHKDVTVHILRAPD